MMTSSPGSSRVRKVRSSPSLPPTVTRICPTAAYSRSKRRFKYREMAPRRSERPALGVYLVKPFSSEKMPASRMCQGVWKSGSPMPREMPPSIPWRRSKYFRMPEGWISCTRRHIILP